MTATICDIILKFCEKGSGGLEYGALSQAPAVTAEIGYENMVYLNMDCKPCKVPILQQILVTMWGCLVHLLAQF